MLEEIKSVKLKKINNAFNSESVSEETLNLMAELTEKELIEFFYLIEEGVISLNILPYYFVSYSTDKVKSVENKMEFDFINKLLATAWEHNLLDKDASTLLKMLYGLTIIKTDLVKRIRDGFNLNSKKQKLFDIQIKDVLKELVESSENNNLFKVILKINEKDQNLVNENENLFEIKKSVLNLAEVFELYELLHGDYTGKEYLTENKKNSSYEKDLRNKIKNNFKNENLSNYSFLPETYKELIISCVSGDIPNIKEVESKKLDKKEVKKRKSLLENITPDNIDVDDYDRLEPKLSFTSEEKVINVFDRIVNNKKVDKIKEKVEIRPLNSNDLILEAEPKESLSVSSFIIRVLISIILLLALIGWGLSVKSDNGNDVDHIKNITYEEILSYKLSSGGENKFDMKINRSKSEINNGAVEQSNPNIQ